MNDISTLFRSMLVETSPLWLTIEYVVIILDTIFLVYSVLFVRRKSVIIISHGRILWALLVSGLFNLVAARAIVALGLYRGIFGFSPQETIWWRSWLFFLITLIALIIWRYILSIGTYPIAKNALRDVHANAGGLFNCNWPLLPRAANFCLMVLVLFMYSTLSVTH